MESTEPPNESNAKLISSLRGELENVKLAASLLEETKNEEIGVIKQKYEGELASLQRVLKEAVAETVRSTESDVLALHRQNQWLEMQLRDLRTQMESNSQSDGGFVASLIKSMKLPSPSQLAPHGNDHSPRGNPSNLSQEQLDQLKPIVLPFQQEIQKLKTQLGQQLRLNKETQQKLFLYEKKLQVAGIIPESAETDDTSPSAEGSGPKLPASRGDLEIYISVLRTQKQVLQDDMREARQQLMNIRAVIADSHRELKEALQLEQQLSVKSDETQGESFPAKENSSFQQFLSAKLKVLEENFGKIMETATSEDLIISETSGSRKNSLTNSSGNGESIRRSASNLTSSDKLNDSAPARKSVSLINLHDGEDAGAILQSEMSKTQVEVLPGGSMASQRPPTLDINAQRNETFEPGLREKSPTPSTSSLLSSLKEEAKANVFTPSNAATACDMCDNYEQKLQQAQEKERQLKQDRDSLKALADRQKEEILKEREYRANLEMKTSSLADETTRDVSRMFQEVTKLQEELASCKQTCDQILSNAERFIQNSVEERNQIQKDNDRIQELYDKLLGKHRQLADQMRNEFIDLPESQDDLQLHCLKLREELIDERAAKEHLDESLKSEVAFRRSQMDSLQHEKEQLEHNLTEEVNDLRTQLGVMQSKTNQIQEQLKASQSKEEELSSCQAELEKVKVELSEATAEAKKLASDKEDLLKRIHTLLSELNTSESVQKDFVLLSQNLQTQLEKIRQAEHEVRWQHEDDVNLCNSCKQPFHRGRRKQHCWHCGQIFCPNCIPKTVASGPARRPVPVCDVCHTILEREARPFYSPDTNS